MSELQTGCLYLGHFALCLMVQGHAMIIEQSWSKCLLHIESLRRVYLLLNNKKIKKIPKSAKRKKEKLMLISMVIGQGFLINI